VVPLRAGSGTRLKILEAAAAGVPMVSTTIGAEGLNFVHGRHLLLADGVEALTQACLASLEDATAAATRATTAREAVVAGYSWDAAGTILRAALAQLPTRH
jgi:glycosyltransferase involved in cell wall biosynthesis